MKSNKSISRKNFLWLFSMKIKYNFNFHGKYSVLNFLPVQKLIFGHFWNCKNWIMAKKNFFHEIDLFYFTSFIGLDFFKFSGTLWKRPGNSYYSWKITHQVVINPTEAKRVLKRVVIIHLENFFQSSLSIGIVLRF